MTIKEKLQTFADNGMSVSFIARKMSVNPSTLTKWLRDEKGITHKHEEQIITTLQELVQLFIETLEG